MASLQGNPDVPTTDQEGTASASAVGGQKEEGIDVPAPEGKANTGGRAKLLYIAVVIAVFLTVFLIAMYMFAQETTSPTTGSSIAPVPLPDDSVPPSTTPPLTTTPSTTTMTTTTTASSATISTNTTETTDYEDPCEACFGEYDSYGMMGEIMSVVGTGKVDDFCMQKENISTSVCDERKCPPGNTCPIEQVHYGFTEMFLIYIFRICDEKEKPRLTQMLIESIYCLNDTGAALKL